MKKYYVKYGPHQMTILAHDAVNAAERAFQTIAKDCPLNEKAYVNFFVNEHGFDGDPDEDDCIPLAFLMGMFYERSIH